MFIMEQKSIFKTSIWKVFEVFSKNPLKIHFIKEISREINLAPTSVKKHITDLEEEGIIIKKKGDRFYGYMANRESEKFLFYKKILNLITLKESGLVEHINNLTHPKTTILYGSYLKGEDISESDIDLFIISKTKKDVKLDNFEKILKRKIHLIVEEDIKKINKNLKLEIINGLVLQGYFQNE